MQKDNVQTIQDLVTLAMETINSSGYAKSTISSFLSEWRQLIKYGESKNIQYYSVDFGNQFLVEHYSIISYSNLTRCQNQHVRGIQLINELMLHGYIQPRRIVRGYEFPSCYHKIFNDFIDFRISLNIAESSIQVSKLYLERFSKYLISQEIYQLSDISVASIHAFIRSLSVYGKPTINHTMRVIRHLMKWAYNEKIIEKDISKDVPKIHYNRYPKIPSAYSAAEVEQLISVIDRKNPLGKRDYAIILLASKLGLRSSDIRKLTFKNILWEENRLEIFQQKTGGFLTLPLIEEVGIALIDYIKNGRPLTEAKTIMVRHIPPYDSITTSCIYSLVNRYMLKAKIPAPPHKKRGPHALRHSLASSLLESNTPLPVISEILGHVDTNTTSVYLKIDIASLKQCALEVAEYHCVEV